MPGSELDIFCHVPHLYSQQQCEVSLAQFEDGRINHVFDCDTYQCSLPIQPVNFHLGCAAHFTEHIPKYHFISFSSLPCHTVVVRGERATF